MTFVVDIAERRCYHFDKSPQSSPERVGDSNRIVVWHSHNYHI